MAGLHIYATDEQLASAGAEHFAAQAAEAFERSRRFVVALAGGKTPLGMYAMLAQPPYRTQIDWRKVFFFQCDERCVPPEHPDSNFRGMKEALFDHIPALAENIHRMQGEIDPAQAAAEYDQIIRRVLSVGAPAETNQDLFDLALVGMGTDGHAASLFPGGPEVEIADRWVVAVNHSSPPPPLVDRLTLTVPALRRSRQMTFLVSGAAKAAAVRSVLQPEAGAGTPQLPAARIWPDNNRVLWLADTAAASAYGEGEM